MNWFEFLKFLATPVPVEQRGAVVGPARPTTAAPGSGAPDPLPILSRPALFDEHSGSPNLDEFPASNAELCYAHALYHNPQDREAQRHLKDASHTAMRAAAVLRYVRRQAEATRVLRRSMDGRGVL